MPLAKKAIKKCKKSDVAETKEDHTAPARKDTIVRMQNQLERYGFTKFNETKDESDLTLTQTDSLMVRFELFETTGQSDFQAGTHLINQAQKAQPEWMRSWNKTTALMHSIAPQDGLEGLLAAQMVASYNMSMECARRAMAKDQHLEVTDRCLNQSTKMMKVFTSQMEALQKYRSKGQQQIVVKHQQVNVSEGGQAIVGDVTQGGGGRDSTK